MKAIRTLSALLLPSSQDLLSQGIYEVIQVIVGRVVPVTVRVRCRVILVLDLLERFVQPRGVHFFVGVKVVTELLFAYLDGVVGLSSEPCERRGC